MKPKELYDTTASDWSRSSPNILTDFTARPFIFDKCMPVNNTSILDLGCGEGYACRQFKQSGAANVVGVDISESMIKLAEKQKVLDGLEIDYRTKSILDIQDDFQDKQFDLVVAIFVYNYLSLNEMYQSFSIIHRLLKTNGRFIFSLPHPMLPFCHSQTAPTFFDSQGYNYFTGSDKLFSGKTWCLDGTILDVQMRHKTFQDIYKGLTLSGFDRLPALYELTVTEEIAGVAPDFFNDAINLPLHIVIEANKT